MSQNQIDDYLWKVKRYLLAKYGTKTADREVEPLEWYIYTGRASATFLGLLRAKKPYCVARLLHDGGSTDEVIKRVKNYINFKGE